MCSQKKPTNAIHIFTYRPTKNFFKSEIFANNTFFRTFAATLRRTCPQKAVKVWVQTYWNSVLQRYVFGFLNLRNSNYNLLKTLQSRCYG